jgi:hypothetical protein
MTMAKARRRRPRPASGGQDWERRHDHWRADGTPKSRFATQEEANRASLRLRLEEGADLDPYPCPYCGGWHLGNRQD